jgi:hypothetical protein
MKVLFQGTKDQFKNLGFALQNSDNSLPTEICFNSWVETYFEVVSQITYYWRQDKCESPLVLDRYESQGTGGLYELAEELTNEFQLMNEGRQWDGEFFDEINEFLEKKLA